ncbi:MAG: DUF1292 domain-containing protein [Clostridia bacterium]|nr:DUF1292 domain-containing protein [Clostridia bacterium]
MEDNILENDYFTLTDEDGNEIEFELIAQCERNGQQYLAMIPVEDEEKNDSDVCEYIILKVAEEDGEEVLVTVDDDDELDDVADYFDDLFTQEIDYDN